MNTTENIQLGSRVRYFDMANPLRAGSIVGELPGGRYGSDSWTIRWDEDDEILPMTELHGQFFHTTVTKAMLESQTEAARILRASGAGERAGWSVTA